jgi:hypothetical protein
MYNLPENARLDPSALPQKAGVLVTRSKGENQLTWAMLNRLEGKTVVILLLPQVIEVIFAEKYSKFKMLPAVVIFTSETR